VKLLPLLAVILGAGSAIGASCANQPAPTLVATPGPADTADCAHLVAVGCVLPNCTQVMANARFLGTVPEACILSLTSPAGAASCGVSCP